MCVCVGCVCVCFGVSPFNRRKTHLSLLRAPLRGGRASPQSLLAHISSSSSSSLSSVLCYSNRPHPLCCCHSSECLRLPLPHTTQNSLPAHRYQCECDSIYLWESHARHVAKNSQQGRRCTAAAAAEAAAASTLRLCGAMY